MSLSVTQRNILQQAKNDAAVCAVYREQVAILLKAIQQVLKEG